MKFRIGWQSDIHRQSESEVYVLHGLRVKRSRLSQGLAALLLILAVLTVGQGVAKADYPDYDCTESTWGDIVTKNGETWICTFKYDEHLGISIYIWIPAYEELGPPDLWEFEEGYAASFRGSYSHLTRSRVEQLPDGIHTGADDYSYNNNRRAKATHVSQNVLYYWNGSGWSVCGDTGQITSGPNSYAFAPTWGWGNACGQNRSYGTIAYTWQWTGSAWNGSNAWSGQLLLECAGCLAAAETSSPSTVPPVPDRAAPTGPPGGRMKLQPPSGKAPVSLRISQF